MLKIIAAKKGTYFLILRETALVLGWGILILFFLTLLVGFFGGWFLARRIKLCLLKILSKDKILIFAPHPDDEALACGGLIAYLSQRKIPKKIVFLTVGDGNPYSFWEKRKIKYAPQEFIKIGIRRQKEALEALKKLGVKQEEVIFLGYPDTKLEKLFKTPKKTIGNRGGLDFVPYEFCLDFRKEAKGKNLLDSLKKIIVDFRPTKVFLPHRKESNSDHRAVFLFLNEVLKTLKFKPQVFQYLIHFRWKFWRVYPGKPEEEKIVYPPKFLVFGENWYSFWLSREELEKKKKALLAYKSQIKIPTLKSLFRGFLARNEIFEEFILPKSGGSFWR
ncbi:MAG: PIG-L family deacetylase [Microgenomates group bacterium]